MTPRARHSKDQTAQGKDWARSLRGRTAAMPRPDYDPSSDLPVGRGVWYRLHVKGRPLDEAHARSRPFDPPPGKQGDPGLRGYSAFPSPHTLSQYMDEYGWRSEGLTYPDHAEVIAFHGKFAGRGDDNEPLVMPEANPHCCGRVIHSRMPFSEMEDRIWEHPPERLPAKPWDSKFRYENSPRERSYRRQMQKFVRRVDRGEAEWPPLSSESALSFSAAMPRPDYDPSAELPEGRGLWYRAHDMRYPLDRQHARSAPLSHGYRPFQVSPAWSTGLQGYSAFPRPHDLSAYIDAMDWKEDPSWPHRKAVAFHGKQAGVGEDGEPLVMPEANPHCCGRVIHSVMPWNDFEDRLWSGDYADEESHKYHNEQELWKEQNAGRETEIRLRYQYADPPERRSERRHREKAERRMRREAYGAFDEIDWDEIHPQIDEMHRGIGVTLPDDVHRLVHDRSLPQHERARALLHHVSDPDRHGYRGAEGGLGTHWTLDPGVAEDFADDRARYETEHENTRSFEWGSMPQDLEHGVYRPPPGPAYKPSTAVVLHAGPPSREDIDEHAGDMMGVYHPFGHGEREIPVRSGGSVSLTGISWKPVHHWEDPRADDDEYEHHDFPQAEYRTAAFVPRQRIFGPTYGLDRRLFEGDRLRPQVRRVLLAALDGSLEPVLGSGWQRFTRAYLAGSQASRWTSPSLEGNGDLDVILALGPGAPPADPGHLNVIMRAAFDEEGWHPPFDPQGTYDLTGYFNSAAWDIRQISPYAAYDLLRDRWAVEPPDLPGWSAEQFPQGNALFQEGRALGGQVRAILRMPEPFRAQEAKRIWSYIRGGRDDDFSPGGLGWQGTGNALEKMLDQMPGHLVPRLKEAAYQDGSGPVIAAGHGEVRDA